MGKKGQKAGVKKTADSANLSRSSSTTASSNSSSKSRGSGSRSSNADTTPVRPGKRRRAGAAATAATPGQQQQQSVRTDTIPSSNASSNSNTASSRPGTTGHLTDDLISVLDLFDLFVDLFGDKGVAMHHESNNSDNNSNHTDGDKPKKGVAVAVHIDSTTSANQFVVVAVTSIVDIADINRFLRYMYLRR